MIGKSLAWACETCDARFISWCQTGCPECRSLGVRSSVRQYTVTELARRRIRRALARGHIAEAAMLADAVLDAVALAESKI